MLSRVDPQHYPGDLPLDDHHALPGLAGFDDVRSDEELAESRRVADVSSVYEHGDTPSVPPLVHGTDREIGGLAALARLTAASAPAETASRQARAWGRIQGRAEGQGGCSASRRLV